LTEGNWLRDNEYGFSEDKLIIYMIRKAMETDSRAGRVQIQKRKLCALGSQKVINAFNMA